jgi:hypothetical protein
MDINGIEIVVKDEIQNHSLCQTITINESKI